MRKHAKYLIKITIDAVPRQVPAFAVTDDTGKPYVAEINGQNKGFFFLDPDDAEQFSTRVKELQQGKPVGEHLNPNTPSRLCLQ